MPKILIHTSVKLVTNQKRTPANSNSILIHTSVKLVTLSVPSGLMEMFNFNPHEREARDIALTHDLPGWVILIHTSVKLVTFPLTRLTVRTSSYFNPHEREARDQSGTPNASDALEF